MRSRAECAAGLRDLVLVVREDKVDAAAMDVEDVLVGVVAFQPAAERLEQLGHRHGRAFDMPARPAEPGDACRRRPARLARLRRLPQHEVHLVALVGGDVDAGAGQHLVERAPRQRAVARAACACSSPTARTAHGLRRHRRRRPRPAARSWRASRRYIRWRAAGRSARGSPAPSRRAGTARWFPR